VQFFFMSGYASASPQLNVALPLLMHENPFS